MYRIVEVPVDAAETLEQLGSKHAFWLVLPDYGRVLFKPARADTGEHWAEKIACEIASLLKVPRAQYELASCGTLCGVLSISLVSKKARLVHGNELVVSIGTEERSETVHYQKSDNTLRRVLSYFKASSASVGPPYGHELPEGVVTALDVFVGYLMFDVLIANQDRHEENWAVLRSEDGLLYLAPSYDHGSSLGRNESDDRRETILSTKDSQQSLKAYVHRAKSAFYSTNASGQKARPMKLIDVFLEASRLAPLAANAWLNQLRQLDAEHVNRVMVEVPNELMSQAARRFAAAMILENRDRLLAMGD